MKNKILSLFLAVVMLFGMAVPAAATTEGQDLSGSVVILHTNDMHGAINGYAKVAALKDSYEARGAYVLLFDAGDFIQGDPTVSTSQGATAVELMNLAGYDAAVPGNHEFDYGYANLTTIMEKATFTALSPVNVQYNGNIFFKENIIYDAPNGTKIGVFGISTPETATKAHPAKIQGVTFQAGAEMYASAQAQVDKLTAAGCETIVCLAHLGIDEASEPNRSIDLLNNVNGIDVLIDGHSHSTFEEMAAVTDENMKVNGCVLTSTGTKLASVGVITIGADNQIQTGVTLADALTAEDAAVAASAAAIQKQVDDDYGTVFATTEILLNGERSPGNRTEETNLGDLITDALLWGAEKNGEAVDAAITNGGGIRATINAGNVTKKDINTVLPFGNTLSIIKITGQELLNALEASTYCTPEAVGAFPQVAGIEFTLDTGKYYAKGEQYPGSTYYGPAAINRVTIQSVGGKPFDPAATYSIATNDFLAAGGDTYYAFATAISNYDTGIPMDEVVMDYVKTVLGGVIKEADYGTAKGRITMVASESASYVVQDGDTLWTIAQQIYGTGVQWEVIYEQNKEAIADPNMIQIGVELQIPAA